MRKQQQVVNFKSLLKVKILNFTGLEDIQLLQNVLYAPMKKKTNIQWIDHIDEIMMTYNSKDVHSSIGQTPNKARDKDNEFKSRINVSINAKKQKLYPELNVGGKVKIRRKNNNRERKNKSFFER